MKMLAWESDSMGLKKASGQVQAPDSVALHTAQKISNTLFYFLSEQTMEAKQLGGSLGESLYQEAQYIMAVLADEIFLNLHEWSAHFIWKDHLLEQRLFRSHNGGDRFFTNLSALLSLNDPIRKDLGFVYLNALGLGFRGKFRGFKDQGALQKYKSRLFDFLYHKKPDLFEEKKLLFPQTVEFNSTQLVSRPIMKESKRWGLILVFSITSYLLFSYATWYATSHHLHKISDVILDDIQNLQQTAHE